MIPVVSLNSCLYFLFSAVYEDSQCINALSETESWICHQLCSGFFAYCAMDCCVDLLEKAKKHCSFCMI